MKNKLYEKIAFIIESNYNTNNIKLKSDGSDGNVTFAKASAFRNIVGINLIPRVSQGLRVKGQLQGFTRTIREDSDSQNGRSNGFRQVPVPHYIDWQ